MPKSHSSLRKKAFDSDSDSDQSMAACSMRDGDLPVKNLAAEEKSKSIKMWITEFICLIFISLLSWILPYLLCFYPVTQRDPASNSTYANCFRTSLGFLVCQAYSEGSHNGWFTMVLSTGFLDLHPIEKFENCKDDVILEIISSLLSPTPPPRILYKGSVKWKGSKIMQHLDYFQLAELLDKLLAKPWSHTKAWPEQKPYKRSRTVRPSVLSTAFRSRPGDEEESSPDGSATV